MEVTGDEFPSSLSITPQNLLWVTAGNHLLVSGMFKLKGQSSTQGSVGSNLISPQSCTWLDWSFAFSNTYLGLPPHLENK